MNKKKLLKYSIAIGIIKKIVIVLLIAYSSNASSQSSWVYEKKIQEITEDDWKKMDQVDKDYYWNKANTMVKYDLLSMRKRLVSFEKDKSTIPAEDEFRDVEMESGKKTSINKIMEEKKEANRKEDFEEKLKNRIFTRGKVSYDKRDLGVPTNATIENVSYYKTQYNDWVTYEFKLGKRYWTVTLGNSEKEVISVSEFNL